MVKHKSQSILVDLLIGNSIHSISTMAELIRSIFDFRSSLSVEDTMVTLLLMTSSSPDVMMLTSLTANT